MATLYPNAYFRDAIVPLEAANLNITTSAVLYGLSVYSVFHVSKGVGAFRLPDHYQRLINSARIIGLDTFEPAWSYERFEKTMADVLHANNTTDDSFVRVSVHVDAQVPGTRSRGLSTALSAFAYKADPLLPQDGVRLKSSVWRRIPDYAIPSRAKVNGAYVNSVLAKQDALGSGYDDCLFLDAHGHVCELSAANIFIVRGGVLITPGTATDMLEGINRRTVLELAVKMGIPTEERTIDLTELYIADEVFICGTSAFIAPVCEVDARKIAHGPLTAQIREAYMKVLHGHDPNYITTL